MRPARLAFLVPAAALFLAGPARPAEKGRTVEMLVTEDGFVPDTVKAKKGEPLTLVVTRKTDRTCAKEIVIKDYGIEKKLPKDQPVTVSFTPTKAGNVRYACGMDMSAGTIVVE